MSSDTEVGPNDQSPSLSPVKVITIASSMLCQRSQIYISSVSNWITFLLSYVGVLSSKNILLNAKMSENMFIFPKPNVSRNNCFGIGANSHIMWAWSTDLMTCQPQLAALSTHRHFSLLIVYLEIYLEVILQWASFHVCVVLVRLDKTLDVGHFKLSEKERNELFWIFNTVIILYAEKSKVHGCQSGRGD